MRRAVLALGSVACVAFGVAGACGFPDPDFVDDDQAAEDGSTPKDSSGGSTDSSFFDVVDHPDGNTCKGDPECDCDDDRDRAVVCGGGDCNDRDDRVHSAQSAFIDAVPEADGGDWNCDGRIEFEAEGGLSCSSILDGGRRDASEVERACTREGFVNDRPCGEEDDYVVCEPARSTGTDPVRCREKNRQTRTRSCR